MMSVSIVPGAIAIVMTMIGTLLTALVVAREWERGTMEAMLATPVSVGEILAGMNFRLTRMLGMYFEGRYRPFFDGGVTPASAGFGAGISVRF